MPIDLTGMEAKHPQIIFFQLLLLVIGVTQCQERQFEELIGEVTVAGMFHIYRIRADKCELVTSSVMAQEAAKWVFKILNMTRYFPFNAVPFQIRTIFLFKSSKTELSVKWPWKRLSVLNVFYRIEQNGSQAGLEICLPTLSQLYNSILGFIDGLASGLSFPISETIQPLDYVQISYASTNPSLSDINLYPYFMRTITPDNKQTHVMIQILSELKSEYIQVVYIEGIYGKGSRDVVRNSASPNKICIVQEIIVQQLSDGNYHYSIEELRKKPFAKIVIIFISSNIVPLVMKEFNTKACEFVFIGSEA
ncbi:hypothetical protein CHS0354_006543 [Potamilus streckersoni]|uniref:Receptor ligand binding region domain-containing protein n=1 Tax=Potamilus streckersoni TaxID=2493646 RepID=A0AAE0WAC4_9BIVA|nr:hypothetical protein CHS0354_006543 [Potamilus streckersoni]